MLTCLLMVGRRHMLHLDDMPPGLLYTLMTLLPLYRMIGG